MPFTLPTAIRHEGEPVKGSRFIVTARTVADEDDARSLLAEVRAEMPDAGHHCSAWRLARPAIDRASDDGEPGGSAGRPILAQLTGRDLVDAAVIVTRYWGGTKLGIGGLVRAYGGAAGEALDTVTLVPWQELITVTFTHSHASSARIEQVTAAAGGVVVQSTFGSDVVRDVSLPLDVARDYAQAIADATSGATVIDLPDQ